jgi:low temperature requirement protein LtrA
VTPSVADTRVSTLELFFDLVFVFVVTQLAGVLDHRPTWTGAAQALLEIMVVYWMYGGFAWLTNSLGSAAWRQRTALFLGMAAFLVVALAVPSAFGQNAVAFGVAYLFLTVVHTAGFLVVSRGAVFTAMTRIGPANLVAAGLILGAGFAGSVRWPLWALAVAVQWVPPLAGLADTIDLSVDHFAERHGLMIIIALGESLVSVALAGQGLPVRPSLVVGTLCGLAAVAAMWWAYFVGEDEAGAEALRARPPRSRGVRALVGYDLSHVLMMGGIVAVAAGTRLSLPRLTSPIATAPAAFIAAGAATYLAGLTLFRLALGHRPAWSRTVGAALLLAVLPVGTAAGAAQELLAVAAVIAAVVLTERWLDSRDPQQRAAVVGEADPA